MEKTQYLKNKKSQMRGAKTCKFQLSGSLRLTIRALLLQKEVLQLHLWGSTASVSKDSACERDQKNYSATKNSQGKKRAKGKEKPEEGVEAHQRPQNLRQTRANRKL